MTYFPMLVFGLVLMLAGTIGQHGYHALAVAFLFGCVLAPFFWRLACAIIRDAFLALTIGFFGGLGVRESGVLTPLRPPRTPRQHPPRKPRAAHRREGQYFPWQEQGDDLPENM
jgi:hypothetical protein